MGESETAAAIDERQAAFVQELTELSRRFGLGITGTPQLFLMERDDYERTYRIDAESHLDFM